MGKGSINYPVCCEYRSASSQTLSCLHDFFTCPWLSGICGMRSRITGTAEGQIRICGSFQSGWGLHHTNKGWWALDRHPAFHLPGALPFGHSTVTISQGNPPGFVGLSVKVPGFSRPNSQARLPKLSYGHEDNPCKLVPSSRVHGSF